MIVLFFLEEVCNWHSDNSDKNWPLVPLIFLLFLYSFVCGHWALSTEQWTVNSSNLRHPFDLNSTDDTCTYSCSLKWNEYASNADWNRHPHEAAFVWGNVTRQQIISSDLSISLGIAFIEWLVAWYLIKYQLYLQPNKSIQCAHQCT